MEGSKYYIDPPNGWKYGFPKEVTKKQLNKGDFKALCVELGYPQDEADEYGFHFSVRLVGPIE
jgi:hypothetical protein